MKLLSEETEMTMAILDRIATPNHDQRYYVWQVEWNFALTAHLMVRRRFKDNKFDITYDRYGHPVHGLMPGMELLEKLAEISPLVARLLAYPMDE
jgi:hypothetical protein